MAASFADGAWAGRDEFVGAAVMVDCAVVCEGKARALEGDGKGLGETVGVIAYKAVPLAECICWHWFDFLKEKKAASGLTPRAGAA